MIFRRGALTTGTLNVYCGVTGKILGGVIVKKFRQVLNGNCMSCA